MMRNNPSVCYEVDIIDHLSNWRSVILWGEYEELNVQAQQQESMKILMDRLALLATSETIRPVKGVSRDPNYIDKGLKAVAYRIKVTDKTGRFEKSH
jgi:nitroimidazol reductase NimA-like FMN-containing flavoprotein (pyridoxamine 5'-phosphate oxidase superfamily)